MSRITLLTEEQCFEDKLEIFEKRGKKAAITDFSILLGGYVSDDVTSWRSIHEHMDSDKLLERRTGYYWTKSDIWSGEVYVVTEYRCMLA